MAKADDPRNSETFQKLLRETGKIEWKLLAPYFESGDLVMVENPLDLVMVAYRFAEDDKEQVAKWLEAGQVARLGAEQAQQLDDENPMFWAVVVAPWVLIQPVDKSSAGQQQRL